MFAMRSYLVAVVMYVVIVWGIIMVNLLQLFLLLLVLIDRVKIMKSGQNWVLT